MTVDELLDSARAQLDRVEMNDLADELATGAVLVDIRPIEWRSKTGEIPGALIIDRNVLLWRLSPSSDTRLVDLDEDGRVILFCNDGFASSIAAAQLHQVGLPHATDLVGGYNAWRQDQAEG